jgi:hypothetical protein
VLLLRGFDVDAVSLADNRKRDKRHAPEGSVSSAR